MAERPVIEVEGVSKHYRLSGGTRSLKSIALELLRRGSRDVKTLKALDDVSFSVYPGETLGVIGSNGAGKSTLLSLLTGTIHPTSGRIKTHGQISSLLELGAGFHPDLSGRENVFLYGAIMGLSRKQMQDRFDAIVSFAELEEFIDQPVKHYSSGMYVRLGFAVAVEVDPQILLIDEVLAVGDSTFQKKCLDKMREFREQQKTMLIISHDLQTIQKVSDRILLLDHGKIIGLGEPEAVVGAYDGLNRKRHAETFQREWGTGKVRITSVEFENDAGQKSDTFQWGGALNAVVHYRAEARIEHPVFGFSIADNNGRVVHGNNTQIEGVSIPVIEGDGVLRLRLEDLSMAQGNYLFSFSAHSSDHKENYHRMDNCFPIVIESSKQFEGYTYMPSSWRTES
jgi:ABC-type polysaccharide/polyol phosphate transport system ATPase subunit